MSTHQEADVTSKVLCDALYQDLKQRIPNLLRSHTSSSCGLYQEGNSRFAYIYHTKRKPKIEIWCRGNADNLIARSVRLEVRPREKASPGWEEAFPARFTVSSLDDVPEAADLLYNVSYRASL